MTFLDKVQGSLLGGAAGDALGFPIEFWNEERICETYGAVGLEEMLFSQDKALLSDDTQMSLFTGAGLLLEPEEPLRGIRDSYLAWYRAQQEGFPLPLSLHPLYLYAPLYEQREPGLTCFGSLKEGAKGSPECPLNKSHGCGGVMRVAPIGLWAEDALYAAELSMRAAALTHGHEFSHLASACQGYLVQRLSHEDVRLSELVPELRALLVEGRLLPGFEFSSLDAFLLLFDKALEGAKEGRRRFGTKRDPAYDLSVIHALGEGFLAEEAFAIALYAALRFEGDLENGVLAAVNHAGDSDSTGAIAGNLMGAELGISAVPSSWTEKLELKELLFSMGEALAG